MIEHNNEQHIAELEKLCGHIFNHRCDVCISRSVDAKLLGGVIYAHYTGESIQAHVAGLAPFWLNPDLLWVIFDYPFNQCHVSRVFCQIKQGNTAALEFNRKLGFKEVCRIDGVFPEGQLIITSLTREDCRWLNLKPPQSPSEGPRSLDGRQKHRTAGTGLRPAHCGQHRRR